jgi:hypothetical protein
LKNEAHLLYNITKSAETNRNIFLLGLWGAGEDEQVRDITLC